MCSKRGEGGRAQGATSLGTMHAQYVAALRRDGAVHVPNLLDAAEIKQIEKEQRRLVDEAVTQAKASPLPPIENLTKNMNLNLDNVVVRGVDSQTFHPVV